MLIKSHTMKRSSYRPESLPAATVSESSEPQDSVTLSGSDRSGWVVAGITTALFSVPLAIGAKSPAIAVVGLAAGLGLMFGPD